MSEVHVATARSTYDPDPQEVRRTLIREMNRAGVYRLEGEYSGGRDEGGLDSLVALDKEGMHVDLTAGGEAPYGHALHQAVESLLSTKFSTWGMEGYASGTVFVDLGEKRAWTEGQEEVTEWQTDCYPIEMSW